MTYDTGGAVTFTSSSLPYLNWKEAQEIDIFNNSTSTQFFMRGGVVYTMVEFPNAMQPTGGNGVANSLSVVNRDGGNIPQGASFVIGPYGLLVQANLFTLLAAGGARQYTNFAKVGGKWEVEEVVRADLNSAGVVFQQGLLADMNGDMKRDLVLIDAGGNIRIYLSP